MATGSFDKEIQSSMKGGKAPPLKGKMQTVREPVAEAAQDKAGPPKVAMPKAPVAPVAQPPMPGGPPMGAMMPPAQPGGGGGIMGAHNALAAAHAHIVNTLAGRGM